MKNSLIYTYNKFNASGKKYNLDCIVLNYHGLIESISEPRLERNFHLYKSFEEQIRFLNKKFNIVSLQEFYFKLSNNLSFKNNVLITFDDGYANNLIAREILDKINPNLSFTIFISTGYIGIKEESIWTVNLALLLLKGKRTDLLFDGENLDLSNDEIRKNNFNIIRNKLKKLEAAHRNLLYTGIVDQYGKEELENLLHQFPQFKMLNWDECRQLITKNTEIESHGVNHELLHSNQSIETIGSEIINSKQIIKENLERDTIAYAYPNGDYSDAAINILTKNHYKLAFTTNEGLFKANDSLMVINRIAPPNSISSFYKKILSLKN